MLSETKYMRACAMGKNAQAKVPLLGARDPEAVLNRIEKDVKVPFRSN